MRLLPRKFVQPPADLVPEPSLLPGAFLVCASSLIITAASAHAAELLGQPAAELIGQPLTTVCLPLIGSEAELAEVIAGARSHVAIDQLNLDDHPAAPRYTSLLVLPHAPGVLVLLTDVTEQSRQQQRLQQQHHELLLLHEKVAEQNEQLLALNRELADVSQRKSDMLAIATHDLRAPLSSLLGFTQLLLGNAFGAPRPEQVVPLQAIQRQGTRVLELINTLLDLRRLESATPLQPQAIDLQQLTAETMRSFADQAALAQVHLMIDVSQPVTLLGDRESVQQALANVLSNAIKYTGAGGNVTLRLQRLHEHPPVEPPLDAERAWCALEVIDTGPGIAEADLPRVFEPFFRTKTARMGGQHGSGLGLAIVHMAVQQHGGRVLVASRIGQGTTFTLILPCFAPD